MKVSKSENITQHSLEAEILLVVVCMERVKCLLEYHSVDFVNSRLSFFSGALWKGGDEGKTFSWWMKSRTNELDS